MEIVLLLAISLPLLLIYLVPKLRKNAQKLRSPPGPRGLPFIGNMLQFDSSAPHLYFWKLSKKYGPLMSIKLGSIHTLVISSASAAEEVFKFHDRTFSNRPPKVAQLKLSYNGLDVAFSPYGDYWRGIRKLCTLHLFSSKRSQSYRPIREYEVSRMIKSISDGAAASKIINLSETVITLTSSVIFRIAFGKRYDEEGKDISRFHWLLTETEALLGSFFVSDFFPLLGWIDRLTGTWGRLQKSFLQMDEIYQQLIDEYHDECQSSTVASSSAEVNILDILLQMKNDSSEIKFDQIKAVLMNVLVAGSDISAAVVIWAMTFLIKNPTTMKKVQEEVRELIGRKGCVNEDGVQKLVYLKAIVKETMRLYPPEPTLVPRETIEKCVLGGYEIQAKTLVFVNAWAIGRDSESWENPEKFFPERFLNSSVDFKGHDFELIPFGAGRRICPGMFIGIATTELALANLLCCFDWELCPKQKMEDIDMDSLPGLAMHKKNDLCLVAKFV